MPYHSSAPQITVAWLKMLPGVPTTVGTTLPADVNTWAENGFVQVSVVGGDPDIYTPRRRPVMQIDCWGTNVNSAKPPWGKTEALAGTIIYEIFEPDSVGLDIVLPDGYFPVRLMAAYVLTEPRRILESRTDASPDNAGFARVQFDLQISWVER